MEKTYSYKDLAIIQLEHWGWNTEKYRLYGLPWYLKVVMYPVVWNIKIEVEQAIKRLVAKENVSDDC